MWTTDLTDGLPISSFTASRYHSGAYNYTIERAFNNGTTHAGYDGYQLKNPTLDDWIKIDFSTSVIPKKIMIQGNDDLTLPKKIKILMSNDDIKYDEIAEVDNIINNVEKNYYIYRSPKKKYRFLKMQPLEFHNSGWMEFNQLEFFQEKGRFLIRDEEVLKYPSDNNIIDIGSSDYKTILTQYMEDLTSVNQETIQKLRSNRYKIIMYKK